MILVRLPDESILLMNTSALELFGIDPEKKLPGMSFPSLMPSPLLDPDSGAPIAVEEHPLRKAAKGVITTGYETGIMDRTGSVRYILSMPLLLSIKTERVLLPSWSVPIFQRSVGLKMQ